MYKFLLFVLLTTNAPALANNAHMTLSSQELYQGSVIHVKIHEKAIEKPILRWLDKEVYLLYYPYKKSFEGFIAADLAQKPGSYDLSLISGPSGIIKKTKIKIRTKDYGVRNLTLPPDKVDLSAKDLARADKEKAIMERIWAGPVTPPEWQTPFIMPLETMVTGIFGQKSIINREPRSPHTGVDLRGKKGEPVKAANNGSIIYTGDHFFTGNSVVIDHGGGIFSMYFHLDKINVKKGDKILKGEVVGLVGSTGRSTEPHLHWGMRINNMRIDPVSFVKLSSKLEE